jgi:hypothetical protein
VKSSSISISTHNNLVLALTNTHYKPSLCCLELIFDNHLFTPSRCSQCGIAKGHQEVPVNMIVRHYIMSLTYPVSALQDQSTPVMGT